MPIAGAVYTRTPQNSLLTISFHFKLAFSPIMEIDRRDDMAISPVVFCSVKNLIMQN